MERKKFTGRGRDKRGWREREREGRVAGWREKERIEIKC